MSKAKGVFWHFGVTQPSNYQVKLLGWVFYFILSCTRAHIIAHARAWYYYYLLLTCCSRNSKECWNVEYHEFLSLERYFMDYFNVNTFVDNLLNCWKYSKMHKTICATFCGKPVESVESVENAIRRQSGSWPESYVMLFVRRTAPTAWHSGQSPIKLFSKNLLTK